METLTDKQIQSLHQGIQQLYTLCDLDTFRVNVLSIVDRLVPSKVPVFHLTNMRTYQIEDTFLPDHPGLSSEWQNIESLYLDEHPITQNISDALTGACKISDFVSQKEFHCLEGIYQQFFRPLGTEDQMMLFFTHDPANSWDAKADLIVAGLALNRTSRSFVESDRTILNLLRPHLIQAYSNARKYQQLAQNLSQVQHSFDCLSTVVLDLESRVRSIAPQAITWLETYFAKPICTGQLPDRLRSWLKYQIANLAIDTNLAKACLPLRIQQAGRELTIRLVVDRTGEQYLLLLEEQTLSSLNSLELLGLSQRETEVLALVVKGKDNKSIAAEMNIGISTVRKHLENIYLKLGVQSRTEAIARALEKLGLMV
jgi:DNA-binding CsgD family transcriptional regulator